MQMPGINYIHGMKICTYFGKSKCTSNEVHTISSLFMTYKHINPTELELFHKLSKNFDFLCAMLWEFRIEGIARVISEPPSET